MWLKHSAAAEEACGGFGSSLHEAEFLKAKRKPGKGCKQGNEWPGQNRV